MLAVVRAVVATSGRPVLVRGGALAGVAFIAGAIIFAPHGLRPADFVHLLGGSIAARVAVFGAWVLAATSAIAPAFDARGTRMLRALRPSQASLIGALVALCLVVQLPWTILFARGDGALHAASATLVVVALEASAVVVGRSRQALVIASMAASLVVIDPRPAITCVIAAPLACLAVRTAWRHALEVRGAARIVRRSHPIVALALAYFARMVRSSLSRLQASCAVVIAAGGALALTLRNDPDAHPTQRALVVLAAPLSVACALLASPALETEKRLAPILLSRRTRPLTLFAAMALALATPSSAFAAGAGTIAVATAHAPVSVPFTAIAWASFIACGVAVWARRTRDARRPSTFALGVIAIAVSTTIMAASC